MAGKKRAAPAARAVRYNTPLLFLLLLLIPVYGGYYDFSTFLCGAVLAALLLYSACRAGRLLLPVGVEAWALYGLCACALLSIPFAVSAGMAFTGFLRAAVWVLFFLYAFTYSPQERQAILDTVAFEGAALSLLSTVVFLCQNAAGIADRNGRIDGLFQYANTWALFQLVCLILLLLRARRRPWDWPAMAVLLCGIFLSGSRGSFVLLVLVLAACGVGYAVRRRKALPLLLAAAGVVLIGALAVLLSGGMVWSRIQAMTLSSSSLNGRLLYDLDGLRMLWNHPLGLGRGGYFYAQLTEQTGVYTLQYIHNEYLQAALDGGILAGVCAVVLSAALLLRKGTPLRERAVIFVIAVHALIDFDFQYTAIVFLLLLCGSGGRAKEIKLPPRVLGGAACAVLVLAFGYFSAAYYLDYSGRAAAAYAMFPADLSLAEKRLQSGYASAEQAEPLADRILASTDLSMLAWDCKYIAAAGRGDFPAMAQAKYRYLRLNRYRGEVYEDFASLLEQACAQGSPEELSIYYALAQDIIEQIKEVNRTTSPLAYRIADKPELDFSTELIRRLENLIQERMSTQ